MTSAEIQHYLLINSVEAHLCDLTTAALIQHRWRGVYWDQSGGIPDTTAHTIGRHDWEGLSIANRYCIRGSKVEEGYQYLRPVVETFTLTLHDGHHIMLVFKCTVLDLAPRYSVWDELLDTVGGATDLYLTASDLKWTFILTHEDKSGGRFGPYLAYKSIRHKHEFY